MPSDPEATDACDDGIDQTGTDCAAMVETARQRLYHPPYPQCERHSVRRRRLELSLSTESESQNCALPAENLRVHKSPSVSEQQVTRCVLRFICGSFSSTHTPTRRAVSTRRCSAVLEDSPFDKRLVSLIQALDQLTRSR